MKQNQHWYTVLREEGEAIVKLLDETEYYNIDLCLGHYLGIQPNCDLYNVYDLVHNLFYAYPAKPSSRVTTKKV